MVARRRRAPASRLTPTVSRSPCVQSLSTFRVTGRFVCWPAPPGALSPAVVPHAASSAGVSAPSPAPESPAASASRDGRSLVVSHYRWHHNLGRFAEHSRHWYPRQELTPYALDGLILDDPTPVPQPDPAGQTP